MSNFNWFAHGGPGSHRYPPGSGERPWQHIKGAARKGLTRNVKVGKDKPKKSKAEVLVGDTSKSAQDITNNLSSVLSIIRKYDKKGNDQKITLSDKELSDAIRRLELEKRYSSLTTTQKQSGYEKAMDALSLIGSTTAIAASSVAIAAGIYNIKKRVP